MNSNGSGTLVCRYTYSAFGELLAVTDASGAAITSQTHIAHLNPFRYRGYYYDKETGYYYLQSRYYDSSIGRFLNADNAIASVNGKPLSYNLYAYCGNNPINLNDPTGKWPRWITQTIATVATAVSSVYGVLGISGIALPAAGITLAAHITYAVQTWHYDERKE